MLKKLTIFILVIAVPLGVYLFFYQGNSSFFSPKEAQAPTDKGDSNVIADETDNQVEGLVVTYTNQGFSPQILEIEAGETVTFQNKSSIPFWPASALHPTHKSYPGSDIVKCGTGDEENIFDACRNLTTGESYMFTFLETGEWGYHDHLNASRFGKIIVK